VKSFYFKLFSILAISGFGLIAYCNSFHCTFHFDDEFLLIDNLSLRNISNLQGIWNFLPCRFIFYLSLAVNYHFHQLDVYGYHVVNLAFHIISAILVWWLVLLTLSSPVMDVRTNEKSHAKKKTAPKSNQNAITSHAGLIALLAGLIFVTHPIQTQAVTYIVQRAAIMATMFYVATLCLYAKSRLLYNQKPSSYLAKIYYIGALLTAIMAMFSKEIAITLPLMILLYEFCFFKLKKNLNWAQLIPLLLTILIIPLTMFYAKSSQAINAGDIRNAMQGTLKISSSDYLTTQFRVIVTYIRLMFLPIHQNLDYDYPISKSILELPTLLSFLSLIMLLYAAKRLFSKYRLLSFSICWFFLSLLPESSIFPINDVIFEHRLYLPMVGFSIFLVSGLYYILPNKNIKLMVITLILLICCYTVLSFQRNKVWIDEMTLLNDIVQKSPNKARPHNNRGNAFMKEAKFSEAMLDLNKAIELDPNYVEPLDNRGLIYNKQGNITQALADYNKAIEIDPHFAGSYDNRADVFNKQGKLTEAIADYSKAIELEPNFAGAYNNRGIIYSKQGKFSEAISDFSKAIDINPKLVEPYYSRGLTYARHDNFTQAIADFTKAIELKPNNPESYNNRGFMHIKKKNYAQALSDYNKAIELSPKMDTAYINRAVVYEKLKEFNKAWADVRKAEKLGAIVNADFIRTLQIESGLD